MARLKKLPEESFKYLSRASGATLSLPPNSLGVMTRQPNENILIAELVAGNRQEFSLEYISLDRQGKEILKSDRFKKRENNYIEIPKGNNDHHHIETEEDMTDRFKSILSLQNEQ